MNNLFFASTIAFGLASLSITAEATTSFMKTSYSEDLRPFILNIQVDEDTFKDRQLDIIPSRSMHRGKIVLQENALNLKENERTLEVNSKEANKEFKLPNGETCILRVYLANNSDLYLDVFKGDHESATKDVQECYNGYLSQFGDRGFSYNKYFKWQGYIGSPDQEK